MKGVANANQRKSRSLRPSRLRYPSDFTAAEWAHVEPLIPPVKRGGNRRQVAQREVVNGLMYVQHPLRERAAHPI